MGAMGWSEKQKQERLTDTSSAKEKREPPNNSASWYQGCKSHRDIPNLSHADTPSSAEAELSVTS